MKLNSLKMLAIATLLASPLSAMALSDSAIELIRESYDQAQALDAAAGGYRYNCKVSGDVATYDAKTADILKRMLQHEERADEVMEFWTRHLVISSRGFQAARAACQGN